MNRKTAIALLRELIDQNLVHPLLINLECVDNKGNFIIIIKNEADEHVFSFIKEFLSNNNVDISINKRNNCLAIQDNANRK